MSSKVLSIHGGEELPTPEQTQQDLVELLEEILERVCRGEVLGMAYALALGNGQEATGWVGGVGTRHSLHTGVAVLHQRYVRALEEFKP